WSLGILAAELNHVLPTVDILATDLCTPALEKARAGVYTHFEVQRGLPIRRLLDHFEEVDETWRIAASLGERIRWLRLNLVDTFSVQ
ncbi:CheR family methyltransferase, partial [Acinetobacter baumannii]